MRAAVDHGFEVLGRSECRLLLARRSIGRIGICVGALPVILPVNFAYSEGSIYFRTAAGTKLSAAASNAVVAFEVDEADTLEHGGWSVLAVGRAEQVTEPDELRRLECLPLTPWAEGRRDQFVRIRPEILTGRRIVHLPGSGGVGA